MTAKQVAFLVVLVWFVAGVFNYGAILADWTGELPPKSDKDQRQAYGIAALFTLPGPAATPAVIFGTRFLYHGWRLKI